MQTLKWWSHSAKRNLQKNQINLKTLHQNKSDVEASWSKRPPKATSSSTGSTQTKPVPSPSSICHRVGLPAAAAAQPRWSSVSRRHQRENNPAIKELQAWLTVRSTADPQWVGEATKQRTIQQSKYHNRRRWPTKTIHNATSFYSSTKL